MSISPVSVAVVEGRVQVDQVDALVRNVLPKNVEVVAVIQRVRLHRLARFVSRRRLRSREGIRTGRLRTMRQMYGRQRVSRWNPGQSGYSQAPNGQLDSDPTTTS